MKSPASSKHGFIAHEDQLQTHFQALLPEDPDLNWTVAERSPGEEARGVGFRLDGRDFRFDPHYELKPHVDNLAVLAGTARLHEAGARVPLLVTPELSPRLLAECKRHRLSAIDLNGRAWLRAEGLLVDRGALPGRKFRLDTAPRDIFTAKSARIIRCLLTDVDRVWTQAEIVTRTGASSGLVSRVVQHLIRLGFVEKEGARHLLLRDFSALLDEWADADRFAKRAHTACYAGFLGSPFELAHRLQKWAREQSVSLAFTQWIAAALRRPYAEVEITSAYVSRLPELPELEALDLRPVTEGGKLWLHRPDDDGLFIETRDRKSAHGTLTLTTDAQIYLDLQRTGLRGPDAAVALREWDGFCKP